MARSLTARLRTKTSRAGLSVLASLTKQNVCYEILMYYPWVFLFFFIFFIFLLWSQHWIRHVFICTVYKMFTLLNEYMSK